MKTLLLALLPALLAIVTSIATPARAAEKDSRVFEMRTYYAPEGKLDALNARFRDHTLALFQKHGITSIGYWVPVENKDNKLVYVLAYPSREARETSWKNFFADPAWKQAREASERDGKLVAKVEQRFLTTTDFSRFSETSTKPATASSPRVFELRTYTTTPGNLQALHARFRDHTMDLFAKHGMTNLFYWQLMPDQQGAENTLVYLLSHASVDAAKASFDAFRADPAWTAARNASEQKAGGSLTAPNGVESLFLLPTDYSPLR